ncbi:MAG: NAD-dependent malic enzyme [Pseudomonadota bacterium]
MPTRRFVLRTDDEGREVLDVPLRGQTMLRQPLYNKGTAFSPTERQQFHLEGVLPSQFASIELQARRIYASICNYDEPLNRYISLSALQDRNEHLFYRVLVEHLAELMPIVYTPTVGQATQRYSETFRRGRGIWITPDQKGRIAEVLRAAAPWVEVELIVCTDNESILGIGDQGAGGIAICVGKLSLYCAGAGIHPARTLPISLDVGTDNEALLGDDLYLGWPHPRLRGAAYDELVAEFVAAVKEVFPRALVQWEDFRHRNALAILERYRTDLLSFNDDIQGTGAVALAGVLSALRITGEGLDQQRILIMGAGAAGYGIAMQLKAGLADLGVRGEDTTRRIAVLDSRGLVVMNEALQGYKRELAWTADQAREAGLDDPSHRDLLQVVKRWKPTVLIGASGVPSAFDEAVVRAMGAAVERPVIMPFSNPTANAEAVPGDVLQWTDGRALIATGSPFADVIFGDRRYRIGQGNNVFIFPGLGMGALLAGATQVTDGMISAASQALADAVADDELAEGLLFPAIERLREVSAQVASAVVARAMDDGVAADGDRDAIARRVAKAMWYPEYPQFNPVAVDACEDY